MSSLCSSSFRLLLSEACITLPWNYFVTLKHSDIGSVAMALMRFVWLVAFLIKCKNKLSPVILNSLHFSYPIFSVACFFIFCFPLILRCLCSFPYVFFRFLIMHLHRCNISFCIFSARIDECVCLTDRYVLVGGHYDSATYGAVGANSGTAVLTELAKAFAHLADTGQ